MQTLIDTTFSGKDISTAVSVYEYTVATTGMHSFQVRLAAVAGNGDYVGHLTLNDGDAQSDDAIGPRTTYAAASGETAFWMSTLKVPLIAGDVVNIFMLGQGGDTSEAGSVRIFFENYAVAGDEMDLVNAPNATALTAIQSEILSDATPFDGADIDAAISTRATSAEVVTTLAVSATEAAAVASNSVPVYAYYTMSLAVTSTSTDDLSAATKLWFAIKSSLSDADSEAIVYIEETGGLTILNKEAYATAAHGSLTVTGSSGAWVITIKIEEAATTLLEYFGTFKNEMKAIVAGDTVYITGGGSPIAQRVVRAIS